MSSRPLPHMTVDEFLAFEDLAESSFECDSGAALEMEAATREHDTIRNNIITHILSGLRKDDVKCRVYGSDIHVRVTPSCLMKPDVALHCEPETWEREGQVLVDPVAIFEVLSPSTEGYDRGKKFQAYRQIGSFREYFIIAQDRVYVEHHSLVHPGLRQMQEHTQLGDHLVVESLSGAVSIPLSAVYYDVVLP